MKKLISMAIFVVIALSLLYACGSGISKSTVKNITDDKIDCKPTNVSIYLDLSNRLVHNTDHISQVEKDTTIVMNFVRTFINKAVAEKIQPCKDKIEVFFYPTPDNKNILDLSNSLEVDLSKPMTPAQKRQTLLDMQKGKWKNALDGIYSSTIKNSNWVGSDIWGFFNNSVDVQCIKDGYRNILVILTDGYVYHKNDVIDQGSSHSYISPTTLKDANSQLIVKRNDLKNLEVLILEVNPCPQTDFPHIRDELSCWIKGMGITHYYISETDQPKNTQKVIEKFIEK